MSKKAVFIIDLEGNIKVPSIEGLGNQCVDWLNPLEKRLGIADESTRKLTDEFNESRSCSGTDEIEIG